MLLRAFEDAAAIDDEMASPMAQLRLRLMIDVPAVQARARRLQFDAQRQIVAALLVAYPELEEVEAAALVGAFIGAVAAAFQSLGDQGEVADRKQRVRAAVAKALNQD